MQGAADEVVVEIATIVPSKANESPFLFATIGS
jgi:hypothetical protein